MKLRGLGLKWMLAPLLSTLLGIFALLPVEAAPQAAETKQALVAVKGMACSSCARRLEKVLGKLSGATKVEVQLEKEQVRIEFAPAAKIKDQQIEQAIRDAGFKPGKIEWRTATTPVAAG